MQAYKVSKHQHFFAIGLSYEKADAIVRGKFSLSIAQRNALLEEAKELGLDALSIISTCNRTELYGFADQAKSLIDLLCKHSNGSFAQFEHVGYTYEDAKAIDHIFRVGGGLDSQILGDFEIISQLKSAFTLSKKHDVSNAFLERLFNAVIQTSRRIKNETQLSSGATSVSFASVQYILQEIDFKSSKNILLFGTGKIGRNTCENLVKHTHNKHITLINRTKDKAEEIAGKFNLSVKDFSELQTEIRKADILIVATGAQHPTITKELIFTKKPLLVLDLSIPKNVDENVTELANVNLMHMDHLSKITDQTLEKRKAFIPQAEDIIEEIKTEFYEWLSTRKFAPTIKALKQKLELMKVEELDYQGKKLLNFNEAQAEIISDRIIHKITRSFAAHLRNANGSTDASVELLNKVFDLSLTEKA
ncbi:glutamyl-tRNA reductase [Psychroflexus salis]|uniref:Glutamyl-tRNA reductase n=1 Tax=Psychroflexus salis TaxID=1526574 RepID=A0A916ZR77_9FLAO|nr:glutamyl-tRNA reductase [Psychroflexus salis]GGE08316.1 glutamyl-tRNA reductase [Psychroflexus salis]